MKSSYRYRLLDGMVCYPRTRVSVYDGAKWVVYNTENSGLSHNNVNVSRSGVGEIVRHPGASLDVRRKTGRLLRKTRPAGTMLVCDIDPRGVCGVVVWKV